MGIEWIPSTAWRNITQEICENELQRQCAIPQDDIGWVRLRPEHAPKGDKAKEGGSPSDTRLVNSKCFVALGGMVPEGVSEGGFVTYASLWRGGKLLRACYPAGNGPIHFDPVTVFQHIPFSLTVEGVYRTWDGWEPFHTTAKPLGATCLPISTSLVPTISPEEALADMRERSPSVDSLGIIWAAAQKHLGLDGEDLCIHDTSWDCLDRSLPGHALVTEGDAELDFRLRTPRSMYTSLHGFAVRGPASVDHVSLRLRIPRSEEFLLDGSNGFALPKPIELMASTEMQLLLENPDRVPLVVTPVGVTVSPDGMVQNR